MTVLASKRVEEMPNDESHLTALVESREDAQDLGRVCEIGAHVPWYAVAAGTVLAVAYVTYQLIYLLPGWR